MREKRGREGWRKGEEWGMWGGRGCEEPEVGGDTGEMERGPRCVMVVGPHVPAPQLSPWVPHISLSSFPATFYPPQPPPQGRGKKKRIKKRAGKKENKISTVVETRGEK